VLGGDVFVLELVGFFVGDVHDALDPRGDEDLPCAAAKDVGLGAGAQDVVEPLLEGVGVDLEQFKQLADDAFRLFDQRQQYMLGIDLVVPVALDDLSGALCGFLGTFGKSVKSHHRGYLALVNAKDRRFAIRHVII